MPEQACAEFVTKFVSDNFQLVPRLRSTVPWQESFGDYGELENFTWNAL